MIKKILKFFGIILLLIVLVIAGLLLSMKADIPESTYPLPPAATVAAPANDDGYLIFGATRNSGLMVAGLLAARGEKVTGFARPTSDIAGLEAIGAAIVVGDANNLDDVRAAFEGRNYRAVLTTIGCLSCEPPPDFTANKHVVDAALEAGVRRVVLVTTIGAGDSQDAPPWLSNQVLARTLPLKTRAEDHIRVSGLDYTIVRPGGMRSGLSTGNAIVSEDPDAFGFIFREDLAQILVAVLDDPGTIGKTLAAIDGRRQWPWSDE